MTSKFILVGYILFSFVGVAKADDLNTDKPLNYPPNFDSGFLTATDTLCLAEGYSKATGKTMNDRYLAFLGMGVQSQWSLNATRRETFLRRMIMQVQTFGACQTEQMSGFNKTSKLVLKRGTFEKDVNLGNERQFVESVLVGNKPDMQLNGRQFEVGKEAFRKIFAVNEKTSLEKIFGWKAEDWKNLSIEQRRAQAWDDFRKCSLNPEPNQSCLGNAGAGDEKQAIDEMRACLKTADQNLSAPPASPLTICKRMARECGLPDDNFCKTVPNTSAVSAVPVPKGDGAGPNGKAAGRPLTKPDGAPGSKPPVETQR